MRQDLPYSSPSSEYRALGTKPTSPRVVDSQTPNRRVEGACDICPLELALGPQVMACSEHKLAGFKLDVTVPPRLVGDLGLSQAAGCDINPLSFITTFSTALRSKAQCSRLFCPFCENRPLGETMAFCVAWRPDAVEIIDAKPTLC